MKVLVVGSGAREHSLCWKLAQSPKVKVVYCAPGNPGIASTAKLVGIKAEAISDITAFAKEERIDLTVVGPEAPLALGIVDHFCSAGLRIFGPTKAAAQLEASKAFAKEVMVQAGVDTARHLLVSGETEAKFILSEKALPFVLKADGLAAGKGVVVCTERHQVTEALRFLFGELKATEILVEDFLRGVEVSFIAATNGTVIVPLASSHDYKRIKDKDQGPNTGGMGSVSPTPRLAIAQEQAVLDSVIRPVIETMAERGTPFSGFLYAGLMVDGDKVSVVEFNARLGDPECQSIMRRMDSDLFEILWSLSDSNTSITPTISWSSQNAICLVLAASGYPEKPRAGDQISGIELTASMPDVVVFHAGTAIKDGHLVTNGGRVLSVTATGPDVAQARQKAYRAADMIQFNGRQLRRDIGS
jgi:phosphoribosylamine--glycine ligase